MQSFVPVHPYFARLCEESRAMLTVLILAALYGVLRTGVAAVQSLRGLPRSNEDMIFF